MWTAVKWLVFSSSLTTQSVLTLALTADKETWISWKQQKVCFYLKWSAHFLTESELTVKTIGWHLFSITVDRYFFVMPPHTCALSGVSPPAVFLLCSSRRPKGAWTVTGSSVPHCGSTWLGLMSPHHPQSTVLFMCCHGQLTRFITFSKWQLMGPLCPRYRSRSCRTEIDGSTEE